VIEWRYRPVVHGIDVVHTSGQAKRCCALSRCDVLPHTLASICRLTNAWRFVTDSLERYRSLRYDTLYLPASVTVANALGQDRLGSETMCYAPEAQAGCTPIV